MMISQRFMTLALSAALCIVLTGCQATQSGQTGRQASFAVHDRSQPAASLEMLERLYHADNQNPDAALDYARALRKSGFFNRGTLVLKPFIYNDGPENAMILTEYAAIQAASGNYIDAEQAARKAVMMAPDAGQAYHVLGIALDAQGHHEQAQVAFDKGLERWEGDPSPILNNIGLNLAAQGFLDEAVETLRRALDTAPNREEIERNLRIVTALQYQPPARGTIKLVPKPLRKPYEGNPDKAVVLEPPVSDETVTAVPIEEVEQEPAGE